MNNKFLDNYKKGIAICCGFVSTIILIFLLAFVFLKVGNVQEFKRFAGMINHKAVQEKNISKKDSQKIKCLFDKGYLISHENIYENTLSYSPDFVGLEPI